MNEIKQTLEVVEQRFNDIKPNEMNYMAEYGFAVQHLKANNYLMSAAMANVQSLQQAMVNIAAIGLSLNPAEKHAYLIPRSVKAENNRWETRIFLEPSYMGLIKLATNTGSIEWAQARIVHKDDTFKDNGVGNAPTHEYNAFAQDRGAIVGVYCVAKTKTGDHLTTIMTVHEINDIRDRSEAWKKHKSGPWKTDYKQMAMKSVIRNAFKTWPRTDENLRLAAAVNLSNKNEGLEDIQPPAGNYGYSDSQKQYFDQLIDDKNNLGMYILKHTLVKDDSNTQTWISLMSSFPKGKKGILGDMIKDMVNQGEHDFDEIVMSLIDSASSGDSVAVMEVISELNNDELSAALSRLNGDDRAYVEQEIRSNNVSK